MGSFAIPCQHSERLASSPAEFNVLKASLREDRIEFQRSHSRCVDAEVACATVQKHPGVILPTPPPIQVPKMVMKAADMRVHKGCLERGLVLPTWLHTNGHVAQHRCPSSK